MTVQIKRGSSGQSTFVKRVNEAAYSPWDSTTNRWGVYFENTSQRGTPSQQSPEGWSFDASGNVSVPSDARPGFYQFGYTYPYHIGSNYNNDQHIDVFAFEVVCMTVKVKVSATVSQELANGKWRHGYIATVEIEGGTAPFTYAWAVPGESEDIASDGSSKLFHVINDSIGSETGWGSASVYVTDADGVVMQEIRPDCRRKRRWQWRR